MMRLAASVIARYSKAKDQDRVDVEFERVGKSSGGKLQVVPARDESILRLRF